MPKHKRKRSGNPDFVSAKGDCEYRYGRRNAPDITAQRTTKPHPAEIDRTLRRQAIFEQYRDEE